MLWDRVSLSLSTASLLDYLGRPITKILSGSPFLSVFPFDVPRDTIFPFSSFFFFFICRKRIFDERIIFWKIWRRVNPRLRTNMLERVTRFKKKYRNDAYRAEFIHFQGRIYNNLQRGWSMVRVLEMILHSSGMNNSCTFYKIFEGNDHYLSLTSNTNKFIRFVLLVQKKKKKKKGERKK